MVIRRDAIIRFASSMSRRTFRFIRASSFRQMRASHLSHVLQLHILQVG